MILNLFPSWTGRLQILFGVATHFRLPMLPAFEFIAQRLQPHCQFGPIDRSYVSLRNKEFVGLKAARRSVGLLSYVEDDGVGVELRCGIAINGTCSIVFKSSSNKLASRLGRVDI